MCHGALRCPLHGRTGAAFQKTLLELTGVHLAGFRELNSFGLLFVVKETEHIGEAFSLCSSSMKIISKQALGKPKSVVGPTVMAFLWLSFIPHLKICFLLSDPNDFLETLEDHFYLYSYSVITHFGGDFSFPPTSIPKPAVDMDLNNTNSFKFLH